MNRGWILNLREAERTFSNRLALLRDALTDSDLCPHDEGEYCSCYVMDAFDTSMVYSSDGETYRVDYTIADDGAVTLGADPVEVIPTMTYPDAPADPAEDMPESKRPVVFTPTDIKVVASQHEAGKPITPPMEFRSFVPLVESALSESATAHLKLIQPGWGSSGYYPSSTLKAAASAFPKGTKMFWNHQTAAEEASRPEGNLDHLAAELTEDSAYREDGPAGPGLYAKAKVFDRYKGAVNDLKDSIGVSIRAYGLSKAGEAEGRKGPIIEKITGSKSVDFVTVPGAGGQILNLFEAAGRVPQPPIFKENNEMTEEQIKALVEAAVKPLRDENAALKTEAATLKTDTSRLRESLALSAARTFAATKLKTITMPDATRARLTESLALNPPLKDGALDTAAFTTAIEAAAKSEVEYLQNIGGMGRVQGMGASTSTAPEVKEADLIAGFVGMGMSEAAAKVAAAGRSEAW